MSDDPAPGALRSQHDQDDQNDDLSRGVRRGASEGFGTASQLSVVRAFVEEHLAAILVQGDEFGRWWNFAMHNVRNKILQVEQAAVPAAELREQLAALSHDQWAGWMRYLFSRCYFTSDGAAFMEVPDTRRWQRQMNTPYVELSEPEKESDREEADRVLEALKLPSSTNAVDPQDRRVDGSQRAAETSSDPDRGAALGRLPRERRNRNILLLAIADAMPSSGLDPDAYDGVEVVRQLVARLREENAALRDNHAVLLRESQGHETDADSLRAENARLRHLAHQLEGYAKHAFTCEAGNIIRPVKCPACGETMLSVHNTSPYLNDDQFAAIRAGDWFCKRHEATVYVWNRGLARYGCTCGLAALTEPPA